MSTDPEQIRADIERTRAELSQDVDALTAPVTLVRGGSSPFVSNEDAAELAQRATYFRGTTVVENSGHSVQSDQPLVLTDLLRGVLRPR